MWELIRLNKRRAIFLLICMGIALMALGFAIDYFISPGDGGIFGLLIAFVLWCILGLVSYYSGDSIILALSHAREVTHDVHPQLFNIVQEMKIAANLPVMPKIYIIPDPG